MARSNRGPGSEGSKQCPECKEWIDKDATKCPYCHSKQPLPPWAYGVGIVVVVLLIIVVVYSC